MVFSQHEDPKLLNAGEGEGIAFSASVAPSAIIISQHFLSSVRQEWRTDVKPALTKRNTTAMRAWLKALDFAGKLIKGQYNAFH